MDGLIGRSSAVAVAFLVGLALPLSPGAPVAANALQQTEKPPSVTASAGSIVDPAVTQALEAARNLVLAGHLPDAVAGLATFVNAHPGDTLPATFLGDLYVRSKDRKLAEQTYLAALRHDPDASDLHDRLGTLYVSLGRTNDAIAQFTAALPLTSAYVHLVELHRRIGDLAAYEDGVRDQARSAPFDAVSLLAAGVVFDADNRSADAIPFLRRAADLEKHPCVLLSTLGDAYFDSGDLTHAIDTFNQCLALDPNDYSSLVDLSSAELESPGGHVSEALALLKRAENVDPNRPEIYVNYGFIEDEAGRWQNAVEYYRKALSIDPLSRAAYVDLGYDYLLHGLYGSAEETLDEGLGVLPADGRLHYVLGLTYARQGKHDLARAEFRRAMTDAEPAVASAAAKGLADN